MFVERDLLVKLYPYLERKEFIAIIGPRQAGKTTLLTMIEEYLKTNLMVSSTAIHFITFEDPALRTAFESDPIDFITSLRENAHPRNYYLLDEYQYVKEGGQKLKLIYDTIPDIKIILTGSSSLELQWQVGKFMVGRLVYFKLFPFNFHETLSARDSTWQKLYQANHQKVLSVLKENEVTPISDEVDSSHQKFNQLLESYCIFGGYPAVVLESNREIRERLLRDIYNAFLLRDIKDLLSLATDRELFRLSQFVATQIGSIVVYQNLCNVTGLTFQQLKKHLHILEETFIITFLSPYFRNKQKELSKNPKVYFVDPGLRNSLVNNFNNFIQRSETGQLIENFVWRQLAEIFEVVGNIHFWRTKAGAEVDFLVKFQGELLPIEVKYTLMNKPQLPRHLKRFIDNYHPRKALVLNRNFWGSSKYNNCRVHFAPVYYL